MLGGTTENARLSRSNPILGIESCNDDDDLSSLGMVDRCRRLPSKVVGVLHVCNVLD